MRRPEVARHHAIIEPILGSTRLPLTKFGVMGVQQDNFGCGIPRRVRIHLIDIGGGDTVSEVGRLQSLPLLIDDESHLAPIGYDDVRAQLKGGHPVRALCQVPMRSLGGSPLPTR
jgi:hypothetical protein